MEHATNPNWKSKDFYLSCVIRASGFSLLRVDRGNRNFVTFVFDISSEKAEKIISLHWSKELKLPTRDLIEAINELRTRLKSLPNH